MKEILGVHSASARHWVGDGFPVRTLFSYADMGQRLSPFLLLDYAGPAEFAPTTERRGVAEHPHRGFETVTIVYQGEVEHRDSTGGGGRIGPGDVQWMTAGAGILHEEFHSADFARRGGTLEIMQLWVNLPAKDKMTAPRYQTLLERDIPRVDLPHHAGQLRVIAGEYAARRGRAHTFSPLDTWDVRLLRGRHVRFNFAESRSVIVVVLHGTVRANDKETLHDAQWVTFGRKGGDVLLDAMSDATLLVLSGQPLNEPVVGSGPFVMNTRAQLDAAFDDYRNRRFGSIPPVTA